MFRPSKGPKSAFGQTADVRNVNGGVYGIQWVAKLVIDEHPVIEWLFGWEVRRRDNKGSNSDIAVNLRKNIMRKLWFGLSYLVI